MMFYIFKTLLQLNLKIITIILLFFRYYVIIKHVLLLCFVNLPTAKSLVISVAINELSTIIFNQIHTCNCSSKNSTAVFPFLYSEWVVITLWTHCLKTFQRNRMTFIFTIFKTNRFGHQGWPKMYQFIFKNQNILLSY